jgi:uncharacterized protein (DUF1697 family)
METLVREACPFQTEPAKLLVMFLAAAPTPAARRAIEDVKPDPERLALVGREIYIDFVNGIGKSKLSVAKLEKAAGAPGTCRNWNTIAKMADLAAACT